jgi:hypothetical protein
MCFCRHDRLEGVADTRNMERGQISGASRSTLAPGVAEQNPDPSLETFQSEIYRDVTTVVGPFPLEDRIEVQPLNQTAKCTGPVNLHP